MMDAGGPIYTKICECLVSMPREAKAISLRTLSAFSLSNRLTNLATKARKDNNNDTTGKS